MLCPNCGADNIPGIELCESCGSDLAGLDIPEAGAGFAGRLMTDTIGALGLTEALTADAGASVESVIQQMRSARHGCVQVLEGGRLAGIFTERDVLARVVRPGVDPATTKVKEVMTPEPTTLRVQDPPAFAIHRMVSQGFRHLPILDRGSLAGSISVRNILRYVDREILGAGEGG